MQFTVVVPSGKADPDGGTHVTEVSVPHWLPTPRGMIHETVVALAHVLVTISAGQVMWTQLLQQAEPRSSTRMPVTLPPSELVTRKASSFQPGTKPEMMLMGVQFRKAQPLGSTFAVGTPLSQI